MKGCELPSLKKDLRDFIYVNVELM